MTKLAVGAGVLLLVLGLVVTACGKSAYESGYADGHRKGLASGQEDKSLWEHGELKVDLLSSDPRCKPPDFWEWNGWSLGSPDDYESHVAGWYKGYRAGYREGFPDYDKSVFGDDSSHDPITLGDVDNSNHSDDGVFIEPPLGVNYDNPEGWRIVFFFGGTFIWEYEAQGMLRKCYGDYFPDEVAKTPTLSYVTIKVTDYGDYPPPGTIEQTWTIEKVESAREMPGGWREEDGKYYYWRLVDPEGTEYEPTGYF